MRICYRIFILNCYDNFHIWLLGTMTAENIREKLRDAMIEKDKRKLDKVLSKCVAVGLPELQEDIQQARSISNILAGGTGG
uniref:Uncharacterized protein n=1 Tax=Octopus bimaculoides TaxID=37653 RepID=A0A0L8GM25_OCTBM